MSTDEKFDVFISYSRADKAAIQPLIDVLIQNGLKLWWDQEMPVGVEFQHFIPQVLQRAQSCIVFWTKNSIDSSWVRSEANRAAAEKKLLCVELDDAEAPPPFDAYNNLRMTSAQLASDPTAVLRRLSTGLELRIGRNPLRRGDAASELSAREKSSPSPIVRNGYIDWLPSGQQVGRYQIIRMLGRGGFWIAYQAWDVEKAEQVVLREGAPRDSGDRSGFDSSGTRKPVGTTIEGIDPASLQYYQARSRTAQMIHKASNEAAVGGVIDSFSANGTWYAVSRYARGETLTQHALRDSSARRIPAITLFQQLTDLLLALHRLDYVHGDLKPENIIVSIEKRHTASASEWQVKLIDFDTFSPFGEVIRLLSPTYSAPEALGGRTTLATEIYSLGVVLFAFWGRRVILSNQSQAYDSKAKLISMNEINPKYAYKTLAKGARSSSERRLALSIAAALSPDPLLRPQSADAWRHFVEAGDFSLEKRFKLALAASNNTSADPNYRDAGVTQARAAFRTVAGSGPTKGIDDWRPPGAAVNEHATESGTRVVSPWNQNDNPTVLARTI